MVFSCCPYAFIKFLIKKDLVVTSDLKANHAVVHKKSDTSLGGLRMSNFQEFNQTCGSFRLIPPDFADPNFTALKQVDKGGRSLDLKLGHLKIVTVLSRDAQLGTHF